MTIEELKNKIILNEYPKILIFSGKENYIKMFYLKHISKDWKRLENFDSLHLDSKSIFKSNKNFYLVNGEALNEIPEKEIILFKNRLFENGNVIVILYNQDIEIAKHIKETFSEYIIEFSTVKNLRHIINYFSKKIDLSKDKLIEIIENNQRDYSRINLEIEKIKCYSEENKLSTELSYGVLQKENILNKPIKDVLFDFGNAILSGNLKQINFYYTLLLESKEPILGVIKLLYDQFKDMYMILASENNPELRNKLGIKPGRIWVLKNYIKRFSIQEIERNMKCLEYIEAGLKNGNIDNEYAYDYLLLSILL